VSQHVAEDDFGTESQLSISTVASARKMTQRLSHVAPYPSARWTSSPYQFFPLLVSRLSESAILSMILSLFARIDKIDEP
jgi:hypothetical protein